jgi:hypothetical protein
MNGTLQSSSALLPVAMPHIGAGVTGRRCDKRVVVASVYDGPRFVVGWSGVGAVTKARRYIERNGGSLRVR